MRNQLTRECRYLIGIDEVGRGPLAGPVTVAAAVCNKESNYAALLEGIRDSKQLSPQLREEWYAYFLTLRKKGLLDWRVASITPKKIDTIGIAGAIRLAVARSIGRLGVTAGDAKVFLDGGLKAPTRFKDQVTIIKGDEKEPLIAAASIIAKVFRDKKMARYAKQFPSYGFELHKGYGTAAHYRKLKKHGMCVLHRLSFLN